MALDAVGFVLQSFRSMTNRSLQRLLRNLVQFAALALILQVVGMIVMDRGFPLGLYEVPVEFLTSLVPGGWQTPGNILLGLGSLALVAAGYALLVGAVLAVLVEAVRNRHRNGAALDSPGVSRGTVGIEPEQSR